jgi:hypothetical protein
MLSCGRIALADRFNWCAGLPLYYGWLPLTYLDTAAAGMGFHIGPLR